VIGFLDSGSPGDYPDRVAAFRQGLKEVGYVEGENVAIDFRWAMADTINCRRLQTSWFAARQR